MDETQKPLTEEEEIAAVKRARSRQVYANNLEKQRARNRAKYAANKEYYRQKHKEWWAAHPEKAREYGRKKTAEHPERERARVRKWHAENADYRREYKTQKRNGPDREEILKVMRYAAHREYLSREKFDEIYPRLLTGPCEICGVMERMMIDHCHEKNVFRGVLCDKCNRGIGFLQDDPSIIRKAAEYLERNI